VLSTKLIDMISYLKFSMTGSSMRRVDPRRLLGEWLI